MPRKLATTLDLGQQNLLLAGTAGPDLLIEWAEAEAYQLASVTYDSTYPQVVGSASVVWPDGTSGTFTTDTINSTWIAIDAYHITYAGTVTKTVTQTAVARDSTTGQITSKPNLTVS